MKRLAAVALTTALFSAPALAEPVEYEFDMSHANIAFSYNHLGYSTTDGRFGDWEGTLVIDEDAPENSSVEIIIDMNSIDTFWEERDAHLKSADFFNVEANPTATFKSTKVEQVDEDELEITGDLTINGQTRETVLEVDVNKMAEHPMLKKPAVGFTATTTVLRSEFGMDKFVPYVSDEVDIVINAEALIK
ncbi:polyisoprenoid-binding protein [Pseudovibrio exalbescens]|uniref:Polyisoprenoid-binding protein n=2 Tax=Pseudovibrio exalbescens TaxID=197461 RepID=A0A1U7JF03_9HYPH|nr:polyisoprenoid-binding protein [Pseudovibrio exalbescens]